VFSRLDDDVQVTFPDDSNVVDVLATRVPDDTTYPPLPNWVATFTIDVEGPPKTRLLLGTGLIPLCIRLPPTTPNPNDLIMVQYDLLGDVDQDGIVHQRDASRVIRAMYTRPGDKKWDRSADLNHDRRITMEDLDIVLDNMWETQPTWVRIPSIVLIVDPTGDGPSADDYIIVCGFPDHFSGWGIRR
jgi:hypothetical protein